MINLPNPELCRRCGARGVILNTRTRRGFKCRRYECRDCTPPHRWSTYETLINPRFIQVKQVPGRQVIHKPR